MNEMNKKLWQEPIEACDDALTPEQREMALYEGAVETFGVKAQILMAIEEMSELTKALLKYIRYLEFGHGSEGDVLAAISEERADVEIMLNQLHVIFGDNSGAECLALEHLADLLEAMNLPQANQEFAWERTSSGGNERPACVAANDPKLVRTT